MTVNQIDIHVGRKLQSKRLDTHMSLGDVARTLDVGREILESMEAGLQRVSAEQLFALCRLFSITPWHIYEGLSYPQRIKANACGSIDDLF